MVDNALDILPAALYGLYRYKSGDVIPVQTMRNKMTETIDDLGENPMLMHSYQLLNRLARLWSAGTNQEENTIQKKCHSKR